MKLTIDTDRQTISNAESGETLPLYSTEGFKAVSDIWLKVGWNENTHIHLAGWADRLSNCPKI